MYSQFMMHGQKNIKSRVISVRFFIYILQHAWKPTESCSGCKKSRAPYSEKIIELHRTSDKRVIKSVLRARQVRAEDIHTLDLIGSRKETVRLKDLSSNGKIILEWTLKNRALGRGLD